MPTSDRIIEFLKEVLHYLELVVILSFFLVGIWVTFKHGLEFLADYWERLRDKEHRFRVRTTIVKDMMEEEQTRTAKLRRLRVSRTHREIILDSWPEVGPDDDQKPANLSHFYSLPGRLGIEEGVYEDAASQTKKRFRLQLGRDEELRKHREYSTLLGYTMDAPLDTILTPPVFVGIPPLGKECFTYEAHFPPPRRFVRNRNLADPNSKEEPRIKVYYSTRDKAHELRYEPRGWKGEGHLPRRLFNGFINKFRARYHVIGGRADFNDGHGMHDWFRVTVLKPPQNQRIHICWCMQGDPVAQGEWCKHSAEDHRRDMNERIESARARFRRLALFKIDPKTYPAASLNWEKNKYLLNAADVIDEIFWRQISHDTNYQSLLDEMGGDEELEEMLLLNRGPYERFNKNKPFLDVEPELQGKGFYPRDLTREEFLNHIKWNEKTKAAFESPYTVIERDGSQLQAIPYHVAYQSSVERLSEFLRQASKLERDKGFQAFLAQRAVDLLTDDYYASEILWVKLEGNPIDFVIGPYEVYEDNLMGLKAAYEAIMFERDFDESAKIVPIQRELGSLCEKVRQELGRPLSVSDERVMLSVANLIYAGGEARKVVPATAFSLPNDERVIEEVGARQVIFKNVIKAKFNEVAYRINNRVLKDPLNKKEAFAHFFTHTLFHEIAHSLGPQRIVIDGENTTVNRRLRQYHSVLEEAKADCLGVCLALHADENLDVGNFLRGHIGRFVRSIRFGVDQAHGGANAIQFNYLLREGAFKINLQLGKISVNVPRARDAIFKLTSDILDIQQRGDLNAARNMVNGFCEVTPEIQLVAERVKDLPIDIRIRYLSWVS